MKIKLNEKNEWEELPLYSKEGIHIDGFLKKKLDNVLLIQKKDWDIVFLIDGKEGSGKSTLSFICGWYLTKGKLTMKNICEGTIDAMRKLENLPSKSVLIIDEGSLMFSSKDAMNREQRNLIKILQVIRQKGMILIIVAPSIHDLAKYIVVARSRFLLHVYSDKNFNRGRFCYFGERKKKGLYFQGKKNYGSYKKPKANFVGSFTKFKLPFDKEYQLLKARSLREAFEYGKEDGTIDAKKVQRELVYDIAQVLPIKINSELAKVAKISDKTLYNWIKKEEADRKEKDDNKKRMIYEEIMCK